MYTAVAGLLNVLAIYDAFEGPAYYPTEDDESSRPNVPGPRGGRRRPGRSPVNGLKPEAQA